VDYDGEPTEVKKFGFGGLNRRLGGGGQAGDHGRYTPMSPSGEEIRRSVFSETEFMMKSQMA
jgi:hypothetical protein